MSSETATASCFCGACKYEFALSNVQTVFLCSCKDCRKVSASMFATNFILKDSDMHWLSGEGKLTRWGQSATIDSHNTMTNSFCSICGTLLNRQSSGFPGLSLPRVGTVDDIKLHDEVLKPKVEQYTPSRVAWFHGVGGVPTSEGMFPFGTLGVAGDTPTGDGPTAVRSTAGHLPEYEPPTFSLTPAAQRQIADLIRNPDLKRLEKHLDEAQSAVSTGAAEINDRLTQGRKTLAKRKRLDGEARTEEGDDDVVRGLDELQDKVTRMTDRMEESMRKMIDGKQNVQHIKDSLAKTSDDARLNATQAATQGPRTQRRTRRGSASDNEDDEEEEVQPFTPTDPAGGTQAQIAPIDVFKGKLDDAKTRYQSASLMARYAEYDDYINFKQMVHDAQHPDNDVDVPHTRTWFPQEQEMPPPGVTKTRSGAQADDDDDDIAIFRATISTKCPVTLQPFQDPLSSKLCSHSFEATAILELLRTSATRGSVQCPCTGCRETLTKKDLHRDPVLRRKLDRIRRAKELDEEDTMADERNAGNGRTQRRATLIGDDDEEEVDAIIEKQKLTQRQLKAEPKGTGTGRASVGVHGPVPSTEPGEVDESGDVEGGEEDERDEADGIEESDDEALEEEEEDDDATME
ncbi:hypothetical protein LTS09_015588 [Friedmanniomyces endolithicus]|nr:hypothetical protein LTS09_015588 [Friedmanniomyces endolithicus]